MRRLGTAAVVLLVGCAHTAPPAPQAVEEGDASYYGQGFYGRRTASGEVFRPGTLTAAHRTLPFGTCVRVTVLASGRTVQVRINDRGPFVAGRILDVSETAAQALGMLGQGVVRVRLTLCQGVSQAEAVERLASLAREGAWEEEDGCFWPSTPRR